MSVQASDDSVVAATAEDAGLTPIESGSSLPLTGGTYWIATLDTNSGLIILPPYPMLPANFTDLPTFFITNNEFLVDSTKGAILPSSETLSRADASSAVAAQSQTVESLIEMVETPPSPPTNGETGGTHGTPQPNGLPPTSDTTNIWLLATNETSDIGLQLMNADPNGNNYQLLSTTNLLNNTNWCLGQILQGAYDSYFSFNPVPYTNVMTFFNVHQATPIMGISVGLNAIEPTNSNSGQVGNFTIFNEWYAATNDINVYFTISGTSENGVDYSNLTGVAVIPANQNSVQVNIEPIADGLKPNQTVILSLGQNPDYLIDTGNDYETNLIIAEPQVYPIIHGDIIQPCPNTPNTFDISANDSILFQNFFGAFETDFRALNTLSLISLPAHL